MAQTESGLTVPDGTEQYARPQLNKENQELVDLYDKLDTNSLESAITEQYLSAAKYQDNGVVKYKKLEGDEAKGLASKVLEAVKYHFHIRELGMPEEKYQALLQYNEYEIDGQGYLDAVLSNHFPSANKTKLEKMLSAHPVDLHTIEEVGQNIANQRLQMRYTHKIQDTYEGNVIKMADGLTNILQFLGDSKVNKEELISLRPEEMMQEYLKSLFKAISKLKSEQ